MASKRVHDAVGNTYQGIKVRASTPRQLRTVFDQQNAAIRAQLPLPAVEGTFDLYPYELSTVFAHGLIWAPRPVFQSCTAYDSRLDALNVAHLEGANAPQHVFFQVQSIDERLPALDDAGSWPVLLSRCEILAITVYSSICSTWRPAGLKTVFGADVTRLAARIGSPVEIPNKDDPLWAEINLNPTFLGDLGSSP
jgi:hypothetical protein